jgi:hypothetical protein
MPTGLGAHGARSEAGRALTPLGVETQRQATAQALTHALPKAGFSSPMTSIVLPQTLTGT